MSVAGGTEAQQIPQTEKQLYVPDVAGNSTPHASPSPQIKQAHPPPPLTESSYAQENPPGMAPPPPPPPGVSAAQYAAPMAPPPPPPPAMGGGMMGGVPAPPPPPPPGPDMGPPPQVSAFFFLLTNVVVEVYGLCELYNYALGAMCKSCDTQPINFQPPNLLKFMVCVSHRAQCVTYASHNA